MTKWILVVLFLGSLLWSLSSCFKEKPARFGAKKPRPERVVERVKQDVEKVEQRLFDHPPEEVIILGAYSDSGVWHIKFPDGYGFLAEGDFWKSWRIKTLRRKGAVLVDRAGSQYLVRLRFEYPDEPLYDVNGDRPGLFRDQSAPVGGGLANTVPILARDRE